MLNTGLLLRRPYESAYNAYRRFLIANQTRTLVQIRDELRQSVPKPPYGTMTTETQAQELERVYCDQLRIPYIPPTSVPPGQYRKNCPECARICFQSYLYHYPWFQTCPIHQSALTYKCPECHEPWPEPSQFFRRQCLCCGVRWSLEHLRHVQATSPVSDFDELAILHTAKNTYLEQVNIRFSAHNSRPHERGHHRRVQVNSLLWPSLVYPRTKKWRDVCQAIGAPLVDVCNRQFLWQPQRDLIYFLPPSRRDWILDDREFELTTRKSVDKSVLRLINQFKCDKEVPSGTQYPTAGSLSNASLREVLNASFHTWRALVSRTQSKSNLPNIEYFKTPAYDDPPPRPRVMSLIKIRPNLDRSDSKSVPSYDCFDVPIELKAWLYKTDLWWTFLAIAGYLSTFSEHMNDNGTWHEFYDLLPDVSQPMLWSDARMNICLPAPGQLNIIMPKHFGLIRMNNLKKGLSARHQERGSLLASKESIDVDDL